MRKISVAILCCFAAIATAQTTKQDPTTYTIEQCVSTLTDTNAEATKAGWQYWFIPKGVADTLTVKMSCVVHVMGTHEPHSHNEDEAFFIAQGPVIVHLNGEERTLLTGDSFYTPSGSSHSIRRVSDAAPIKYLVMKRETVNKLEKPFLVGVTNYKIEDCITRYDASKEIPNGPARSFWYITKGLTVNGINVKLSIVDKNVPATHPAHSHPEQEVYFVTEGSAEVTLNGKSTIIAANSSFYCPGGSTHGIKRASDATLKYLVIKTK